MRHFLLHRTEDVTGVSGVGNIAEGIEWIDGTATLRWLSGTPSLISYSSLADLLKVHGHGDKTKVIWKDLW